MPPEWRESIRFKKLNRTKIVNAREVINDNIIFKTYFKILND